MATDKRVLNVGYNMGHEDIVDWLIVVAGRLGVTVEKVDPSGDENGFYYGIVSAIHQMDRLEEAGLFVDDEDDRILVYHPTVKDMIRRAREKSDVGMWERARDAAKKADMSLVAVHCDNAATALLQYNFSCAKVAEWLDIEDR